MSAYCCKWCTFRYLPKRRECRICGVSGYCCDLIATYPNKGIRGNKPHTGIFVCEGCYPKTLIRTALINITYPRKTLDNTLTVEKSLLLIIKDMGKCYKEANTNRKDFWKDFYKLSPE